MKEIRHPWIGKYLRPKAVPSPFCPGCGNGIIASTFIRAVDKLYGSFDNFVFVSGIGCAAWIPSPLFYADTIHTLHGRAIPVAMGIKLAKPHLKVVVISGDGDLASIGGNHLLHAARRNLDILVICVNNFNYAMTGAQASATTPLMAVTSTTPYGNPEYPLDLCKLISQTNANYVARWTVYHVFDLEKSFVEALEMKGFRFIEVLSACPTRWGRMQKMNIIQLLRYFKENSIRIEHAKSDEKVSGRIIVGIFVRRNNPSFLEMMEKIKQKAIKSWLSKKG